MSFNVNIIKPCAYKKEGEQFNVLTLTYPILNCLIKTQERKLSFFIVKNVIFINVN